MQDAVAAGAATVLTELRRDRETSRSAPQAVKTVMTAKRYERIRKPARPVAPGRSIGVSSRVPGATLQGIERHFHALIRARAAEFNVEPDLPLPSLAALLAQAEPKAWFPIDGMYGGFNYWIKGRGKNAKLMVESWSRVVGGSVKHHEITVEGSKLVGEGIDLGPSGTP